MKQWCPLYVFLYSYDSNHITLVETEKIKYVKLCVKHLK